MNGEIYRCVHDLGLIRVNVTLPEFLINKTLYA